MDMVFNIVLKTRRVNEGISKSSIGYSIHNLPVYAALSLAGYFSGIIGFVIHSSKNKLWSVLWVKMLFIFHTIPMQEMTRG